MNDENKRQVARNEAVFREVNEAIERGLWPGEQREQIRFRCECAQLACDEVVELSPNDYEAVRRDPRRFVVRPGHEIPEAELIVERHDEWLVVEKRGESGRAAERLDPR